MSQLHALAQAVDHPAPARGSVPRWRLIASMALAPVSFAAQVVCSYVVASVLCREGAPPQAILLVINALAIVVAVAGFVLSVSSWRATRGEKPGGARATIDIGEGRTRFLALCGLWGSSIFLLAVLLDLTAIAAFSACPGAAAG
jgi:hypothetical protein